jgi:zinc protease
MSALCCAGGIEEGPTGPYQLDNRLTVMLLPASGARHVVLMVLYDIGGLQDPDGKSGLAHLVEQAYVTAPAGETPARSAEEYMKAYPEGWNAQTGDEYTLFAAIFPGSELNRELKDAAARMGDLRVSESLIEQEKQRIDRELANMFERVPALAAFNRAREHAVPSPPGCRRGGISEEVARLTLDDVHTRWQRYYKPANAILVLAGKFNAGKARDLITSHFSDVPPGEAAPPARARAEARTGEVEEIASQAVTPETKPVVCLAYAAPQPGSDLYVPFLVLMARMWQRATELGITPHHFPVRFAPLDDPWVVSVSAPIEKGETPEQVIDRLRDFVAGTVEPALEPGEITAARNTFGWALGLTDYTDEMLRVNPYAVALGLARRYQLGIDTESVGAQLETLTSGQVTRAGRTVFAPDRCATTIATW